MLKQQLNLSPLFTSIKTAKQSLNFSAKQHSVQRHKPLDPYLNKKELLALGSNFPEILNVMYAVKLHVDFLSNNRAPC